ncbi:MAG: shikimate dehydrogenase [Verrucomicrobiota bacterium]
MKEIYTLADLKNWQKATRRVNPAIRLGVFGDPVAQSLSPRMQNAALRDCKIDMQYSRFQILPSELPDALQLIRELNFIGVNLTAPHKAAAHVLMDALDERAQRIGAINTVSIDGEKLVGWNTDGFGFAHAIRSEFSVDLRDLRVMVLGAGGGAGRAIAWQCALERCERLVLANRTLAKAKELERELARYFTGPRVLGPVARLETVPWEESALRFQLSQIDLVVNATPLGMNQTDPSPVPISLLAPHLMIFDAIYKSVTTPLLRATADAGARGANGLAMLLHQGALAFEIWFNRPAPIAEMRQALVAG